MQEIDRVYPLQNKNGSGISNMHYHMILTKECNLKCNYCGGGSDTPPREIQYSIGDLKSFLCKDASPVVEFYGGEPLLRINAMEKIMDSIPARFVLQTNGLFLDRIEPQYLQRFHTILVSVDGSEEVTNKERGKGVYERLMKNLDALRERGFSGDLVARMTVTEGTDIQQNVRYLLGTGVFDHVHWQLDFAMFWKGSELAESDLANWIVKYNSGISSLVHSWLGEMSEAGRVLGIVPFLGIMNSLISGKKSQLRCGSGIDFFSIMPDGRISACPVSLDFDFSVIGSIYKNSPESLRNMATVGEPCLTCDALDICGGRCLFVNRSQEMLRENGFNLICSTVAHLIREIGEALPKIHALVENGVVKRSDFEYPELNNGCEIIP